VAYATKQDMIDRYGEAELIDLSDRAGALDAIDDGVLATAIDDAEAEINGYLSGRYTLPFPSIPRILTRHACTIARYNLLGDRAADVDQATTTYKAAIAFLKLAASGDVSLGDETAADSAASSSSGPRAQAKPAVFDDKSLEGY
jgi:phage gp36-like protein